MALVLPFNNRSVHQILPEVQQVMRTQGLLAVPTETYYGLAVRPTDATALQRLIEVKGRPPDKPILVLIAHRGQLAGLVESIPPAAAVLMESFWPGALTIVFPASPDLSPLLTAGTGTIGVRLSPLRTLTELLEQTGPLTGTSANRSSDPPLDRAEDVQRMLGAAIDVILDGGQTPGGQASTVIDACDQPRLIRDGAMSTQLIREALRRHGHTLSP
jgi:L-threonylcarbamoyladenylate synthase